MSLFEDMASKIIKEQQTIIGPLALREANKVVGLKVTSIDNIVIEGNSKEILQKLVEQYAKLFGNASIQLCREVTEQYSSDIPDADKPDFLK